jgi:hypothetical protein
VRLAPWAPPALACWVLTGCGGPEKPAAVSKTKVAPPEPVKITQFYTSTPHVPRGEKGLVCYGVENAKMVWISPPKQELNPSFSRCIEVEPSGKVTYTLTAEGADGKTETKEATVEGEGPAPPSATRVHIVNVNISAAEVHPGDAVSICYKVQNAASVTIEPTKYRGGPNPDGCVVDQPQKTTTYTIRAKGASGDTDEEHATIRVRAGR